MPIGNVRTPRLTLAVDDPSLTQVVRGQLHANLIAGNNSDKVLSHSARDMCEYFVTRFQLHPETRVRQRLGDGAIDFECFFLTAQDRNLTENQNKERAGNAICLERSCRRAKVIPAPAACGLASFSRRPPKTHISPPSPRPIVDPALSLVAPIVVDRSAI